MPAAQQPSCGSDGTARGTDRAACLPSAVFALGVGAVLTVLSPRGWPVLLTDIVLALAVLLGAAGWGAWPVLWLGFGQRWPGQQVCLATALGLGIVSTATLILGVTGWLSMPVAWGLLGVGVVGGLARLYLAQANHTRAAPAPIPAPKRRELLLRSLVLLPLTVPLAIALFGATLPPGVLWNEEARGYDVLEYHLQVPREYFEASRIGFLPHNVYASFPQQMETLYLLLMHLIGDAHSAAIPAQLLHVLCGVLAVISLGLWTPVGWPRYAVFVVAGSVPWLAYLGCLAYVEAGLLLFAAVAAGLVADHFRSSTPPGLRAAAAAGLCAGLAGGCKYTALVFVGGALLLSWILTMKAPLALRIRRGLLFALGTIVAVSPWLIRNTAFTGNPVYPFAYGWFGGAAWSTAQVAQWDRGHRLSAADAALPGRLGVINRELFKSEMFGPALFALGLLGLLLGRSRLALMLGVWAILMLLSWALLTHMPGRFAVPIVVPLALAAGLALPPAERTNVPRTEGLARRRRWLRTPLVALAIVGATLNSRMLHDLLIEHDRFWTRASGFSLADWPGRTDLLIQSDEVNSIDDPNANVWLVGRASVFYVLPQRHYTVAFNRDPWLEYAAGETSPAECVGWLRTRNVTHVVFSWFEIDRLKGTYGFSGVVTPDWVSRLSAAGLRRTRAVRSQSGELLMEIYEVTPE
ncbi:MAG: hypothetical protein KKB50_05185 [Planctomycetes bacterium]|nr:hypothetical protein [Planctomycetota bacterium]